jgi:hypothetical protein
MSSVASPFGLKPAFDMSGTLRQMQNTILSGFGTSIFQFSPVDILADGSLGPAAAGARAVGTFQGVEFTGTDGRRRVANTWEANTVATDIVAYYSLYPDMVYEIQGNAPILQLHIGQQFDWTAPGGNTTTGLSNQALDVASIAANAGLRVIGFNPAPDNVIGDAFTIAQVQISQHQYRADIASV